MGLQKHRRRKRSRDGWLGLFLVLPFRKCGNASARQLQKAIQHLLVKGTSFGCALHFDELSGAGHDDVEIDFRAAVLAVVWIEHRRAIDHSHTDGGHRILEDLCARLQQPLLQHPLNGVGQSDVTAGDSGSPGAAIGLQHVAVHCNRVITESFKVHDGSERPSDESLDFRGATIGLLAFAGLSRGRTARKHTVFCGDPALVRSRGILRFSPRGNSTINTGRTQHHGVARLNERTGPGGTYESSGDLQRPQQVRRTMVVTEHPGTFARVEQGLFDGFRDCC